HDGCFTSPAWRIRSSWTPRSNTRSTERMDQTRDVPGAIAIDPGERAGLRLRIAQVAAPFEPVPPHGYGGTERVIDALVRELIDRGHDVTTYASGDSEVPGRLVA